METCACCGRVTEKLVLHHWFEPPEYSVHCARVCLSCNNFVTPARLWPCDALVTDDWDRDVRHILDHILPLFFLQQIFVWDGCYSVQYDRYLRIGYELPLPLPPRGLDVLWRERRYKTYPLYDNGNAALIASVKKSEELVK